MDWVEIYPVDSIVHLLENWALVFGMLLTLLLNNLTLINKGRNVHEAFLSMHSSSLSLHLLQVKIKFSLKFFNLG